jgi:hypothetical protein
MRLKGIQKRVKTIESALIDLRPERSSTAAGLESHEVSNLIGQLYDVVQEAMQILKRAVNRGDHRTALAAMPEICRIVELIAKLDGKLDEKPTSNILNVNIGPDTAKRIVEIYAKRHNSLIEEAK